MAESRQAAEIFWVDPRHRGILPIDGFHVSRSLRRRIRTAPFRVTFDRAFAAVVSGCADREETWINAEIAGLYTQLHECGFAHSIELHDADGLAGGVYGVAIGAAFFGESMFSRRKDASKIALFYLVDRLREGGFTLFDTQFLTPHLASLGAIEIPRHAYRALLSEAVVGVARFDAHRPVDEPDHVLQRMTQRS
ncbi:leucyl/phenylalanyl-tRNA--protein transferase [Palleronia aestuarii]|uniref:Leucyl/phenylalanyl-tRNA--protein transferase n=2 Tax=Palleronia aestuarii TaxID=568105 RepID=A0A2W7QD42_9RHOB|nr:leucyl/phenylalanyl-tRNA--protein transferase [Palleronia aestuarii]